MTVACRPHLNPPIKSASAFSNQHLTHAPVYLHDERAREGSSARHQSSQGHLAVLLPGAKIGVLGLNGAGKSTLLRIMAGEDQSFIGEAFAG